MSADLVTLLTNSPGDPDFDIATVSTNLPTAGAVSLAQSGELQHVKQAWNGIYVAECDLGMIGVVCSDAFSDAGQENTGLCDLGLVTTPPDAEVIVPNFVIGGWDPPSTPAAATNYPSVWFPIFVPAGKEIAVRGQRGNASGSSDIGLRILGVPLGVHRPWPTRCVTYGVTEATTEAVKVTPNGADWGTWTEVVAATTHPIKMLSASVALGTATGSSGQGIVQVGYGTDGVTWTPVSHHVATHRAGSDESVIVQGELPVACDLPPGVRLAARGWDGSVFRIAIHGFY